MEAFRTDIAEAFDDDFRILALPGPTLTGVERVAVASATRGGQVSGPLQGFARMLSEDPGSVDAAAVSTVADELSFGPVVETVGIVARLSASERFHEVMGLPKRPLPVPVDGPITGEVRSDLKKRRAHVPMPPGAIPLALDLLPTEGEVTRKMFGPLYMTDEQMEDPYFKRSPGLDTPQLEAVAARISWLNDCFY